MSTTITQSVEVNQNGIITAESTNGYELIELRDTTPGFESSVWEESEVSFGESPCSHITTLIYTTPSVNDETTGGTGVKSYELESQENCCIELSDNIDTGSSITVYNTTSVFGWVYVDDGSILYPYSRTTTVPLNPTYFLWDNTSNTITNVNPSFGSDTYTDADSGKIITTSNSNAGNEWYEKIAISGNFYPGEYAKLNVCKYVEYDPIRTITTESTTTTEVVVTLTPKTKNEFGNIHGDDTSLWSYYASTGLTTASAIATYIQNGNTGAVTLAGSSLQFQQGGVYGYFNSSSTTEGTYFQVTWVTDTVVVPGENITVVYPHRDEVLSVLNSQVLYDDDNLGIIAVDWDNSGTTTLITPEDPEYILVPSLDTNEDYQMYKMVQYTAVYHCELTEEDPEVLAGTSPNIICASSEHNVELTAYCSEDCTVFTGWYYNNGTQNVQISNNRTLTFPGNLKQVFGNNICCNRIWCEFTNIYDEIEVYKIKHRTGVKEYSILDASDIYNQDTNSYDLQIGDIINVSWLGYETISGSSVTYNLRPLFKEDGTGIIYAQYVNENNEYYYERDNGDIKTDDEFSGQQLNWTTVEVVNSDSTTYRVYANGFYHYGGNDGKIAKDEYDAPMTGVTSDVSQINGVNIGNDFAEYGTNLICITDNDILAYCQQCILDHSLDSFSVYRPTPQCYSDVETYVYSVLSSIFTKLIGTTNGSDNVFYNNGGTLTFTDAFISVVYDLGIDLSSANPDNCVGVILDRVTDGRNELIPISELLTTRRYDCGGVYTLVFTSNDFYCKIHILPESVVCDYNDELIFGDGGAVFYPGPISNYEAITDAQCNAGTTVTVCGINYSDATYINFNYKFLNDGYTIAMAKGWNNSWNGFTPLYLHSYCNSNCENFEVDDINYIDNWLPTPVYSDGEFTGEYTEPMFCGGNYYVGWNCVTSGPIQINTLVSGNGSNDESVITYNISYTPTGGSTVALTGINTSDSGNNYLGVDPDTQEVIYPGLIRDLAANISVTITDVDGNTEEAANYRYEIHNYVCVGEINITFYYYNPIIITMDQETQELIGNKVAPLIGKRGLLQPCIDTSGYYLGPNAHTTLPSGDQLYHSLVLRNNPIDGQYGVFNVVNKSNEIVTPSVVIAGGNINEGDGTLVNPLFRTVYYNPYWTWNVSGNPWMSQRIPTQQTGSISNICYTMQNLVNDSVTYIETGFVGIVDETGHTQEDSILKCCIFDSVGLGEKFCIYLEAQSKPNGDNKMYWDFTTVDVHCDNDEYLNNFYIELLYDDDSFEFMKYGNESTETSNNLWKREGEVYKRYQTGEQTGIYIKNGVVIKFGSTVSLNIDYSLCCMWVNSDETGKFENNEGENLGCYQAERFIRHVYHSEAETNSKYSEFIHSEQAYPIGQGKPIIIKEYSPTSFNTDGSPYTIIYQNGYELYS